MPVTTRSQSRESSLRQEEASIVTQDLGGAEGAEDRMDGILTEQEEEESLLPRSEMEEDEIEDEAFSETTTANIERLRSILCPSDSRSMPYPDGVALPWRPMSGQQWRAMVDLPETSDQVASDRPSVSYCAVAIPVS